MRRDAAVPSDDPNARVVITDDAAGQPVIRSALASALEGAQRVLIYSHLNPDPDTVGAALALRHLIAECYGKEVVACYRGIVGRAENRMLMKLVASELKHASEIHEASYDGILLVDCQPDYGFLPQQGVPVLGVIDHHPLSASSNNVSYVDIRPEYGATSTILTEYLREAGVNPPPDLATALFYGLKTDTNDLSRRTGPWDVEAYDWLLPKIDRKILAQIETPSLSREYFECFGAAVGRARTYSNAVMTEIGRMPYSDMVAEVADRLIRLEGMDWSVCFGVHGSRIYLSVRTAHPTRDAGELVKAVLRDEGVGGGHDTMAAGRVQLVDDSKETYVRIVTELWDRFLSALGEEADSARPLVADAGYEVRVHPGR